MCAGDRRGETTGRELFEIGGGWASLVQLRGDSFRSFRSGGGDGSCLLLSSSDLSVVGLLVESDEEEEVRGKEGATENSGTFSSSARSGSGPGREVGGSEVGVG